jgi:hypothetical protein
MAQALYLYGFYIFLLILAPTTYIQELSPKLSVKFFSENFKGIFLSFKNDRQLRQGCQMVY